MSFGMAYATKKKNAKCMANGGGVKGVHKEHYDLPEGTSKAGEHAKYGGKEGMALAKTLHAQKLHEMKSVPSPTSGKAGFAEGGDVDEMGEYDPTQSPAPVDNESANMEDADMIARIMHKRKEYSQGGMVANDTPPIADSLPADFDDLALRDDLDGAQPEDSNEHGDADVSDDPIDRIMMKKKKDKLPRPA